MNIYQTQRLLIEVEREVGTWATTGDHLLTEGETLAAAKAYNRGLAKALGAIDTVIEEMGRELSGLKKTVEGGCRVEGCDRRGLAITDDGVLCAIHTRSAA